jgi:hypothetical protein
MMKTDDLRISGVRRYCRLRSWLEIPVTTRGGECITLTRESQSKPSSTAATLAS